MIVYGPTPSSAIRQALRVLERYHATPVIILIDAYALSDLSVEVDPPGHLSVALFDGITLQPSTDIFGCIVIGRRVLSSTEFLDINVAWATEFDDEDEEDELE